METKFAIDHCKLRECLNNWKTLENLQVVAAALYRFSDGDSRKLNSKYENSGGIYGIVSEDVLGVNNDFNRYLIWNIWTSNLGDIRNHFATISSSLGKAKKIRQRISGNQTRQGQVTMCWCFNPKREGKDCLPFVTCKSCNVSYHLLCCGLTSDDVKSMEDSYKCFKCSGTPLLPKILQDTLRCKDSGIPKELFPNAASSDISPFRVNNNIKRIPGTRLYKAVRGPFKPGQNSEQMKKSMKENMFTSPFKVVLRPNDSENGTVFPVTVNGTDSINAEKGQAAVQNNDGRSVGSNRDDRLTWSSLPNGRTDDKKIHSTEDPELPSKSHSIKQPSKPSAKRSDDIPRSADALNQTKNGPRAPISKENKGQSSTPNMHFSKQGFGNPNGSDDSDWEDDDDFVDQPFSRNKQPTCGQKHSKSQSEESATSESDKDKDDKCTQEPELRFNLASIPRTFELALTDEEWNRIFIWNPLICHYQLCSDVGDELQRLFKRQNPVCVISMTKNVIRGPGESGSKSFYMGYADCVGKVCTAKYAFNVAAAPTRNQEMLRMVVRTTRGEILHKPNELNKRRLKGKKRKEKKEKLKIKLASNVRRDDDVVVSHDDDGSCSESLEDSMTCTYPPHQFYSRP